MRENGNVLDSVLAVFDQAGRMLDLNAGPVDVAGWFVEEYARLFEVEYARIWWIEASGERTRVLYHRPEQEFTEDWQYLKALGDSARSVVSTVITTGQSRLVEDASKLTDSEAESRFVKVYGARSAVHSPIMVGGHCRGDMVMVSLSQTHHFVEADVPVLQAAANLAGACIEVAIARSAANGPGVGAGDANGWLVG